MRDLKKLVLMGFCSLSVGCAVTVEDEEFARKQQASHIATKIKRVFQWSTGNPTSAMCPGSHPIALSVSGGLPGNASGARMMYFALSDSDPVGGVVLMGGANPNAIAVCSDDYNGLTRVWTYASGGNATVSCPSNHVAVGGGGSCESSTGKLYRNRPNPSTADGEPTGWRASCTTGGVTAYANCANKGGARDWEGCRVRSSYSTGFGATRTCNSGELAVGVGSVCTGTGSFLTAHDISPDLTRVSTACSYDATATTYAVCCPGVYID